MNKEDGGNRKFILVEQEDYANTITAERVRRVIKGVKTAKSENLKKGTGGTFSYFQLGDSIEMESILTGKSLPSYEELARYIFYTATGQEFSEKKINRKTNFIGETEHYELYMLYSPNIDWLKQHALTFNRSGRFAKYKGKQRLVFAPAKYVDDYTLLEHRIDSPIALRNLQNTKVMEPIPYFYESINRNAIVVKPKKPFFDWLNYLYPESPINEKEEANIYLIKEKDSNEAIEKWLSRNFDQLFQNELNDWHTDENDWPQKRTYKLFKEWFDFEIHSMVLDLEETEITKD